MRVLPIVMVSLLPLACQSGQAVLNSDGDVDFTGAEDVEGDTASDEDDDPGSDDDDADNDDPEPDPEPEYAFAGDYSGEFNFLVLSDWWDFELEDCETELEVSDEGKLVGESYCEYNDGWNSDEYIFELEADVTDEGDVNGTVFLRLDWGDDTEMELWGEADEDGNIEFETEGVITTDWANLEVIGTGEVDLD